MTKTCYFCNNKVKENETHCWIHNDKPRKINKEQEKKEIEEMLRKYGEILKTGYMIQLVKFRDDTSKNFEIKRRKFKRLEERHNQIMKIWEELFDKEYQVIPNKMKKFMKQN